MIKYHRTKYKKQPPSVWMRVVFYGVINGFRLRVHLSQNYATSFFPSTLQKERIRKERDSPPDTFLYGLFLIELLKPYKPKTVIPTSANTMPTIVNFPIVSFKCTALSNTSNTRIALF